jgi:hypothetical protein
MDTRAAEGSRGLSSAEIAQTVFVGEDGAAALDLPVSISRL